MSLINQMLKDLDERNAPEIHAGLQHEIRRLSDIDSRSRWRVVSVLALLAAAMGGAFGYAYVSGTAISIPGLFSLPAKPVSASPEEAQKIPVIPLPASSDPVFASFSKSLEGFSAVLESAGTQPRLVTDENPLPPVTGVASPMPQPALQRHKPETLSQPKETGKDIQTPREPVAAPAARSAAATAKQVPASGSPAVVEKTAPVRTLRERAEADFRNAVALAAAGQPGGALDQLLDVLRYDGGHVPSRQLAARLLVEQRRPDEAMAILAEGLTGQPGQTQWAMMLARLQVDRGDLEAAARTLQGSSSFAAASADYQGFAGFVAHRLGRQQESADHYRTAIGIAPGEGRWWFGLGLALEAGKHLPEAREAFRRARASGTLNADLSAIVDQKLH